MEKKELLHMADHTLLAPDAKMGADQRNPGRCCEI